MKSGHCDYYNGECCAQWLIGDGTCDEQNNFPSCNNHDGGDCCPNPESVGDGECNPENLNDLCMNDGGDCCNKEIGPGN